MYEDLCSCKQRLPLIELLLTRFQHDYVCRKCGPTCPDRYLAHQLFVHLPVKRNLAVDLPTLPLTSPPSSLSPLPLSPSLPLTSPPPSLPLSLPPFSVQTQICQTYQLASIFPLSKYQLLYRCCSYLYFS